MLSLGGWCDSLKPWLDDPIHQSYHQGSYPLLKKKNCIDMIYHRLQPWLEASVWAQCQVRKSVRYNKRLVLHSMAQARRLP